MNDIFFDDVLTSLFPGAIVKGELDYKKLCILMAQEICDLKDQMNEKDYQILRITERIDALEG